MFAVTFGPMPPFRAPRSMSTLEERGFLYAIRLPANEVLYQRIDFLLTRPVGSPPKRPIIFYHDFRYQAGSWDRSRRVVAKVEWHSGERFPRVGFIVTNLTARPEGVVHFYNQRGTAEQWIKEGKYALNWTRLSCHRFVCNQVRLLLFVLAYNLGNFLRRLALPRGSSTGRCEASRSSSSKWAAGLRAMPGTSSFSWPR